jgi:hypothetical protein
LSHSASLLEVFGLEFVLAFGDTCVDLVNVIVKRKDLLSVERVMSSDIKLNEPQKS